MEEREDLNQEVGEAHLHLKIKRKQAEVVQK